MTEKTNKLIDEIIESKSRCGNCGTSYEIKLKICTHCGSPIISKTEKKKLADKVRPQFDSKYKPEVLRLTDTPQQIHHKINRYTARLTDTPQEMEFGSKFDSITGIRNEVDNAKTRKSKSNGVWNLDDNIQDYFSEMANHPDDLVKNQVTNLIDRYEKGNTRESQGMREIRGKRILIISLNLIKRLEGDYPFLLESNKLIGGVQELISHHYPWLHSTNPLSTRVPIDEKTDLKKRFKLKKKITKTFKV